MSLTQAPASPAAAPKQPPFPSSVVAWTLTALMALTFAFSYIDRQIINLLAQPIKNDLKLDDVELSLLQGPAFAITYVVFGLALGYLADRTRRIWLVAGGATIWSAFTAGCGVVTGFLPLFGCRIGVGIGEAALGPSAVSMISDVFPPPQRPRALAVFNMGTTIGAASFYFIGSLLIPSAAVTLPLVGLVQPWQATFIGVGLPGVLLALVLLLVVREPIRRGMMAGNVKPSLPRAFGFMVERRALFLRLVLGMSMLGLLSYGPASLTAQFFTRTFGWTVKEIAAVNGPLILVSALPGAIYGGWLATRLKQRGSPHGTLRAIVINTCGLVVPITVAYLMPTPTLCWIVAGISNFFIASSINLGSAAMADVTPNQFRGQVVAIYGSVLTLIGLGLGPSLIALITEHVFHDESMIRYSMSIFSAVVAPTGAILLWSCLPHYRRVAEEAQGWTGSAVTAASASVAERPEPGVDQPVR